MNYKILFLRKTWMEIGSENLLIRLREYYTDTYTVFPNVKETDSPCTQYLFVLDKR
jgi:hypothetical protein